MKYSQAARYILAAAITAACLFFILRYIPQGTLEQTYQLIGFRGVLICFGWCLATLFFRSARTYLAFDQRALAPFTVSTAVIAIHQLANHILPARTGEALYPLLFRRYTKSRTSTAVSMLIKLRLQEFTGLGAFCATASAALAAGGILPRGAWIAAAILSAFTALCVLLYTFLHRLTALLPKLACFLPTRFPKLRHLRAKGERLATALAEESLVRWGFWRETLTWSCSIAIWASVFLMAESTYSLVGIDLSFLPVVFGTSMGSFANVLPINSIGSFGSLEAGWTAGFTMIGIPMDRALAVGFVLHIIGLLFMVCSAGLAAMYLELRRKIQRQKAQPEHM